MPTNYKVLGQSAPGATTNTDVYTVPSSTQTVVSTIAVCNRGATGATYRIAIRPGGSPLSNEEYIAFDSAITANNSTMITIGVTLNAGDVVTVFASNANLSFNLFGSEIS